MTPTPKLRWINRPLPNITSHVERVLQQWWEHTEWNAEGEWRDVPIEKEQA
jgi:hypothetical protein